MLRTAVMVSGGGTNLQALIDAVEAGRVKNAQITLVVSSSKNAYALARAAKHQIKSCCVSPKDYESEEAFQEALIHILEEEKIGLIVLAGYLIILPARLVQKYRNRIINIHPSLIPAFCGKGFYGLKVHESVLERGVRITGATVHFVDEGTDSGPIILQQAVEVRQDDTPETLQRRVMEEAEWKILPQAVHLIANGKVTAAGRKVRILGDAHDFV